MTLLNMAVCYMLQILIKNLLCTASKLLELDQSNWDLYAEGFDYKADWATNTRYKINDIAKYNGTVYICTLAHIGSK